MFLRNKKNTTLKSRTIFYLLCFFLTTVTSVTLIIFLVTPETSFLPYYVLIYGAIYTSILIYIWSFEKDHKKPILFKVLFITVLFSFLIALIPFFSIMIYVNSYSNNWIYKFWAILLSSITVLPFGYLLKIILLMAITDKNEELITRNIYSFIFLNWSYIFNENDDVITITKKRRESINQVHIIYINQDNPVKSITFEHKVNKENENDVYDIFDETLNQNNKNFIVIPDDSFANKLKTLSIKYKKILLIYEQENKPETFGDVPKNIKIKSFIDVNKIINRELKNKNE